MIIRKEDKKDYFQVENITREAFWNKYRPGCFEHYVIHTMRNNEKFVKDLDYVVEEDGQIIANIVYVLGTLELENGTNTDILVFGPVSVKPEYQRKGYGEKLINYTLEKAKELGYGAVAITGDQNYYKKYGFCSASKYGVYYKGIDKNEESPFFMIKILDVEKAKKIKGDYVDPTCYFVEEKDVDEFDKQFPKKKKEVKPGQLV